MLGGAGVAALVPSAGDATAASGSFV